MLADRPAATSSALDRCIRLERTRFFDEIWGQRPVLVEERDVAAFADLFSLQSVDAILAARFRAGRRCGS